jgi:hypothetical protein
MVCFSESELESVLILPFLESMLIMDFSLSPAADATTSAGAMIWDVYRVIN